MGILRHNTSHVNGRVVAVIDTKYLVTIFRVHEKDAVKVIQETDIGSNARINTGLEDWVGRTIFKTKGKPI